MDHDPGPEADAAPGAASSASDPHDASSPATESTSLPVVDADGVALDALERELAALEADLARVEADEAGPGGE